MSAKKKKPDPSIKKTRIHKELEGFKIEVDEFGVIKMNRTTEEMSAFLQKHLADKTASSEEPTDTGEEE